MTLPETVLGVVAIRLAGIVLAVLILKTLPDQQPFQTPAAAPIARSSALPNTSICDDDLAQMLRDMRLHD
jgi:hypothetical protein